MKHIKETDDYLSIYFENDDSGELCFWKRSDGTFNNEITSHGVEDMVLIKYTINDLLRIKEVIDKIIKTNK